ncbi:hypothetical protein DI272_09650 [Streptomyces sp. Act143]|uniref:hypothetical protein n=1 Tax=Streptomyces sp. Act143 TaxID=2200760 RepID=UPI000D67DBE0|nr:hypothetical protein [Streptomyces sp. Act143]PWI14397.1 hypothetical protein DI272_09650 [Streptomyces sp. Act143]
MAVDQLPGRIREFVNHLDALLARLDQGGGWCAVFWQRDPEGMRACLEGREVPPWDVVEALLQDLATEYGPAVAAPEAERARALHAAALAAYDARPGARDALGDRLDVMLREQRYAAERQAELGRLLATAATRDAADALRRDLAWARDDHERATARCAELRARMADLDRRARGGQARVTRPAQWGEGPVFRVGAGTGAGGGAQVGDAGAAGFGAAQVGDAGAAGFGAAQVGDAGAAGFGAAPAPSSSSGVLSSSSGPAQAPAPAPTPAPEPPPVPDPAPAPKQRKRRRGSARFAGAVEADAAPVAVPPAAAPTLPAPAATGRRTPRGARFAGAAVPVEAPEPQAEPLDDGARREVAQAVEQLVRLRREGRSGEAHALLVEAAYWPAARFPLLADELQRAGLGADWATLLWEAASLPAERLVAAADALAEAGRAADGEQVLRQGVVRPAGEIGQAVLGLVHEGRHREVRALLDAYVRVRTPEEAARSAAPDPRTLVPLLLQAAQGVSEERRWDLVHALRVAGFTA